MKKLSDIKICHADAINYHKGNESTFLNKIYYSDQQFKDILHSKKYFLLGDKGTGKTAYAVYHSNNETPSFKCSLKFTNETDFRKFLRLIESEKINISDFVSVWKVILLLLVSQEVKSILNGSLISSFIHLRNLNKAIDKYFAQAFSPEITNAIELITNASDFIRLYKNLESKREEIKRVTTTGQQISLMEIEQEFRKAISQVSIKKNFILFIDGTDQIPFDVKRTTYIECLRGLANAIWELNQLIFPESLQKNNPDFMIKIVLLIRPDIFSIIRFHNANTKLKDNSVILSWICRNNAYKTSNLFKLVDNSLSSQQDQKFALGYAWDNYFDTFFEIPIGGRVEKIDSFLAILNRTFMRPRDMFSFMDIMHKEAISRGANKITTDIFLACVGDYSRYLLGEVKDQFNFFHDEHEWEILIDFFKYFNGKIKFDFKYFCECYDNFIDDYPNDNPDVFESEYVLLQSLFASNIIAYIQQSEGEEFYRWSFKEKSYVNIEPVVEYDAKYQFHLGLFKSLGLGKQITNKRNRKRYY